jgi:hypothetical protein
MRLWIIICLLMYGHKSSCQSFLSNTSIKYEYDAKYVQSSITFFTDSTYAYVLWPHSGPAIIDSGTWKLKCDMVMLNSQVSYSKEVRLKKNGKSSDPVRYPIFFRNSCFVRQENELIQEVENGENWVYKKVN